MNLKNVYNSVNVILVKYKLQNIQKAIDTSKSMTKSNNTLERMNTFDTSENNSICVLFVFTGNDNILKNLNAYISMSWECFLYLVKKILKGPSNRLILLLNGPQVGTTWKSILSNNQIERKFSNHKIPCIQCWFVDQEVIKYFFKCHNTIILTETFSKILGIFCILICLKWKKCQVD